MPSEGRGLSACVVADCTYSASDGSAYCTLHGIRWGRPEPSYLCNCGLSFREHLARVAHAATCPTMQGADRERVDTRGNRSRTTRARGICPDSGLPLHVCHKGPCDCFDGDDCRTCYPMSAAPPRVRGGARDRAALSD
jgi:hypothetical protein